MSPRSSAAARRTALIGTLSLVAFAAASFGALRAVGGVAELRALVERSGPWAPLVYILLKMIATILPPVSGSPLRVASGALFGLPLGVLLSLIADLIGGSISFWITRRYGRRVLELFVGGGSVETVDGLVRRAGGWRALLFVRLAVPPIYNYVSYAAGLTRLPYWQFAAVTLFGGILPTVFTVSLGAGIALDRSLLVALYGGLALVAVLAYFGRRHLLRRSGQAGEEAPPGHSGDSAKGRQP